jgi:serine/threonine-protein kinase
MGTPAYVAPERFEGSPATPAADMFALGTLLHHCISGHVPWRAGSPTELVHAQRYLDPDPLPGIDGLEPEVVDLCSRCLARDPARRPTALVAALVLAEAVDARVYVPLRDLDPAAARPSISPWDQRAAEAPTSVAVPAAAGPDRVGRHRAG